MAKTITSLELQRRGDKLIMRAMGKSARGTKYIVKQIEVAYFPDTFKPDPSKMAAQIAEITGRPNA